MADKNVNINPRYLTYNKDEVQDILDKAKDITVGSEPSVRAIVTNYDGGRIRPIDPSKEL